jgi:hypothetical protein
MTEEEFDNFLNTPSDKLSNLQQLNFSNNTNNNKCGNINYATFKTFCINLSLCNNLKILDLSSNSLFNLDKNKFRILGLIIANLPNLQRLDLSYNYLGYIDNANLKTFCSALLGFPGLLSYESEAPQLNLLNIIKPKDLQQIQNFCKKIQTITIKTTCRCDLSKISLTTLLTLGNALKKLPNLKKLELSIPTIFYLNEDRFIKICNILSMYKNLQILYLNFYFIDELNGSKFETLCDILTFNINTYNDQQMINILELCYNDVHIQAFSPALINNKSLTPRGDKLKIINLGNNNFNKLNPAKLKLVCNTLSSNPNLRLISLFNNNFNIILKLQMQSWANTIKQKRRAIAQIKQKQVNTFLLCWEKYKRTDNKYNIMVVQNTNSRFKCLNTLTTMFNKLSLRNKSNNSKYYKPHNLSTSITLTTQENIGILPKELLELILKYCGLIEPHGHGYIHTSIPFKFVF